MLNDCLIDYMHGFAGNLVLRNNTRAYKKSFNKEDYAF